MRMTERKMTMEKTERRICVLGGDERQRYTVLALAKHGYRVAHWGMGEGWRAQNALALSDWREASGKDILILPLPMTQDGVRLFSPLQGSCESVRLSCLFSACRSGLVFAGRVSDALRSRAEQYDIRLIDYYASEALQMRNALPTAEGALLTALQELPVTLYGIRCAVLGYGRIASLLGEKLTALGACVTVYARRERDRLHAELRGMQAQMLALDGDGAVGISFPPDCRVVFNTVPQTVLSEAVLRSLPENCLLIDLASPPGGIDFAAAERLGRRTVWATALPGRLFPESAGEILAATLEELLEKEV